jgi:hypothetical protein
MQRYIRGNVDTLARVSAPAIALISAAFTVDSARYLDFFKSSQNGSGFLFSNGGRLEFRDENCETLYRSVRFSFERIDIAGGFIGLCQRTALSDALRIRLGDANASNQTAELQVNFISSLSYMPYDGCGELDTLADDLRDPTSTKAINNSFCAARQAIPAECKYSMLSEWRLGPPYVFKVDSRHQITVTFDAE